MTEPVPGIHHVTAIAGDPQANLDFYAGVLGLRLVKRTVNFDDPETYHFYFGDAEGRPGTLLTFFPWADAPRGRAGAGQALEIAFLVPSRSLGWWSERLKRRGVGHETPRGRLDEETIALLDPDGMPVALVADEAADAIAAPGPGPVAPEHAIRGVHGVTLRERRPERSGEFLAGTFGFESGGERAGRFRFRGPEVVGGRVDLLATAAGEPAGSMGVGAIHHVAFRARDDARQAELRSALIEGGVPVTPVLDRCYFRSVYFREPGGVLFEIATDPPGFTVDESREELGERLRLPPWLEPRRPSIERALPPVHLPAAEAR